MITFDKDLLEQLSPAFEAIGSNVDHDCGPRECAKIAAALRLLADFAERQGLAKGARENGSIAEAIVHETAAEVAYDCLPTEFKW